MILCRCQSGSPRVVLGFESSKEEDSVEGVWVAGKWLE